MAVKVRWPRAAGGAWMRSGKRPMPRRFVRVPEAQRGVETGNRKHRLPNRHRNAESNGGSFGASQKTGPKAKGRRVVFRTFDGLVQQRMERTFGAITLSHQATPPRASVLSDPLVVSLHKSINHSDWFLCLRPQPEVRPNELLVNVVNWPKKLRRKRRVSW